MFNSEARKVTLLSKILGATSPKTRGRIPKQLPTKNGMNVLYPHAKFGEDRFMHGNMRTKMEVFVKIGKFMHTKTSI